MSVTALQFIQTTPEALTELIKEGVKNLLEDFKTNLAMQNNDELLTREQACDFLQINATTLYHWSNKGRVKAYAIVNRRYYKKSELLEALTPVKSTKKQAA